MNTPCRRGRGADWRKLVPIWPILDHPTCGSSVPISCGLFGDKQSPGRVVVGSPIVAEAEGTANAPPPARRRRSGAVPIAFLIVVLVAYVGLLYLYAVSGRTTSLGDDATPPPGGVVVDVRIAGVDAPAQHLTVDVDLA